MTRHARTPRRNGPHDESKEHHQAGQPVTPSCVSIPDHHLARIITALEFRAEYLRVTKRDGRPLLDTVEELKRRNPASLEPQLFSQKNGA